jgi:DNA-binding NtrC family response regulator
MGLPITQGIIKYLGGGLTIQSTPDAGTCVTILLPVEKISAQAESPNKKNPVQNNILLIEDRDMVRHTIATMLVRCGHTVESTNSGLTALDILRENPDYFQMVISDYTMPEINGKNLIAEIRTDFPTLPIIIMSGDGGHLHELEMDKTQNHIFTLQKPVQAENLFNIMAKIAT